MAVRADRNLSGALIVTRVVETATTVAVGRVVKDGNANGECQPTTDGDNAIGVVVAIGGNTGVTAGAAGDKVQVALLCGACIIPVLVGTGDATRGLPAKVVATGCTDGVATDIVGFFTQSGVAGDYVGMVPCRFSAT